MPINELTNQPINYILHLADDALIMSQRLSEWTGHGPVLEQDIALTNIALDFLGQSRMWYQYAASMMGDGATEDSLAMLRLEHEFKNHLLVELPNAMPSGRDWAFTVCKVFFFSAYQHALMQQLQHNADEEVRGIAAKSLKEVTYHLRWSREWILRLGDGTAESHQRMQQALTACWPFTGELFEVTTYAHGWVDYAAIKTEWMNEVLHTTTTATLDVPTTAAFQTGGLHGRHTEHLGYLLAEMQYLQRAYPNSEW
ncbi:phenylacetate-CoA oxygenase subunit PaaC [Phnomibacter ginsenosidimutans]|uniref:Phenylacetate-CoA oxygenase subunit PaaC n=2 Tax=Phnomibacter ginsenosidimutans TaxID=2676868 RepID=A0A6I6GHN4_9BACT|nr:phenylacetate-CoA oxygenase subunit PaaC [Phnomibacter ginsenosidimutans]